MRPERMSVGLCLRGIVAWSLACVAFGGSPPAEGDSVSPRLVEAGPLRFSEQLILGDYGYAYGIAAADLDGDGDPDLTSSDTTKNNFYWFENDGAGGLTRRLIYDKDPGWFERHAVGDVDLDGDPDIVVVKNSAHDVLWFENSATPKKDRVWRRHVIARGNLPYAYDVTLGDLDGDGDLDVAGSTYQRGNLFAWMENPGYPVDRGVWRMHTIEAEIGGTRTIVSVDLNRDGRMDLLGSARVAGLTLWYENTGKDRGRWRRHVIDDTLLSPTHGHPVDLDKDGDLDVVMAFGHTEKSQERSHQVAWYENLGSPGRAGKWRRHFLTQLYFGFEAIGGDLDGDGDVDVVATAWGAESGRIVWIENSGDPRGEWKKHTLKAPWSKANQVILVDLDQDGRLDIAATAERGANEFRWWRNAGPVAP